MTTINLKELSPQKEFFIGIDSDGCVFDSMEIKHKECFTPNTIKHWKLQPVSKYARETADFVNLYSHWRGLNRWPALIKVFDLLRERPEVIKRNADIPKADKVREFIKSGTQLSNQGLTDYLRKHPSSELETALAWTEGVNQFVEDIVDNIPAFPFTHQSLEAVQPYADLFVVSATPTEALEREWSRIGLAKYMRIIAGQEYGTKQDHFQQAAHNKYPSNHILMIGDALGDLAAARSVNALFYPIVPGKEDQSWERFSLEAHKLFLTEKYEGEYENQCITEFENALSEIPPWEKNKNITVQEENLQ